MGAGDLNLKKSWHPNTFRNQALVWEKEQAMEAETRKIEQMKKELQEERDREELYRLHNQGKNRGSNKERLEWMYSAGPAQHQDFIDQEKEDYLLGKKKIDAHTFKGMEKVDQSDKIKSGNLGAASSLSMYGVSANSARDFASKVREDPLLAFKRQEQATLEAMMKNPLAIKRMQEKEKKKGKKSKRSRSRSPDRHRSRDYKEKERSIDRESDGEYKRRNYEHDRFEYSDRYEKHVKDERRENGDTRQRNYDRYDKKNDKESRHYHSHRRSPSPMRNEEDIKKAKVEAMMKNAKSVNDTRLERITKDREEEAKNSSEERTNASSFSAKLNRSVYEKGSASDMIKRNKAFAAK